MKEVSLRTSLWDSANFQDVIVIGKWWVGKSTIAAAIALMFSQDGEQTIASDMDASHSLSDSLGLSRDDLKDGTFGVRYNKHLFLYFLGQIVPDFFSDKGHNLLNEALDTLLSWDHSMLPLLRLAVHPTFAGLPLPHQNIAYVLQLLDAYRLWKFHTIDGQSIQTRQGDDFEKRLIDCENTQWFIRVILAILSIENTLKNIHKAFHGTLSEKATGTLTREAIKRQANLLKLAQSDVVKNYKAFTQEIVKFHQDITKAKIIVVTQPGWNDLQQTIAEVRFLVELGIRPTHILVNKWNDSMAKDPHTTQDIFDELKKSLPDAIGISVVDSDFQMVSPRLPQNKRKLVAQRNLQGIIESFERGEVWLVTKI